jgi:hypothetical protein
MLKILELRAKAKDELGEILIFGNFMTLCLAAARYLWSF